MRSTAILTDVQTVPLEELVDSWAAQARRAESRQRMAQLEARLRRDPRYTDHRRRAA